MVRRATLVLIITLLSLGASCAVFRHVETELAAGGIKARAYGEALKGGGK